MRMASLVFVGALFVMAVPAHSFAASSHSTKLAKQAKISMAQAKKIALKAFPGKIISEELEKEKGGSGLRYSFDIKHGKVVHEVGVDAVTGKVLENDRETGGD